jgi:hypothetical protein
MKFPITHDAANEEFYHPQISMKLLIKHGEDSFFENDFLQRARNDIIKIMGACN